MYSRVFLGTCTRQVSVVCLCALLCCYASLPVCSTYSRVFLGICTRQVSVVCLCVLYSAVMPLSWSAQCTAVSFWEPAHVR